MTSNATVPTGIAALNNLGATGPPTLGVTQGNNGVGFGTSLNSVPSQAFADAPTRQWPSDAREDESGLTQKENLPDHPICLESPFVRYVKRFFSSGQGNTLPKEVDTAKLGFPIPNSFIRYDHYSMEKEADIFRDPWTFVSEKVVDQKAVQMEITDRVPELESETFVQVSSEASDITTSEPSVPEVPAAGSVVPGADPDKLPRADLEVNIAPVPGAVEEEGKKEDPIPTQTSETTTTIGTQQEKAKAPTKKRQRKKK